MRYFLYVALFFWLVTGAILNYRQYESIGAKERREQQWLNEVQPVLKPRPSSYKWPERAIDASILGLKKIDRTPFTKSQLQP